jgi:hypothetical protein
MPLICYFFLTLLLELPWVYLFFNPDFAVGCKTCPKGRRKPFWEALSGLTLTKMLRILRQPKANFAEAKFGFKKELPYAMVVAFLLNLFTWPLLHVLLHYTNININILELGVAATEGLGFWLLLGCRWQKAWGVAILANGCSYGAGVLLNKYFV